MNLSFNIPLLTEWLIAGVIIYCILWFLGWVNPRRARPIESFIVVVAAWPIIGIALIAFLAGHHGIRK